MSILRSVLVAEHAKRYAASITRKTNNPAKARIHVLKREEAGLDVPPVCQQCESPVFEIICPMKAVSRSAKTCAKLINHDRSMWCSGAPSINPETRKTVKCDLCDGDPQCAKSCPTRTIGYKNAKKATYKKKKEAANKLGDLMGKLATL